jgi:hypothetical protein
MKTTHLLNGISRNLGGIRRIAIILLFLSGSASWSSSVYGQQRYHYRFELQGITDDAGAKTVTDFLRPLFNETESPFAVFPDFNDELDFFDFFSDKLVTREQLESAVIPHGIMVTSFSSVDTVEPQPEKR